jgi:hypothetical protein
LAEAIKIVRRTNPKREIVVGPVGWNGINDLTSLELPKDDKHLIVTVNAGAFRDDDTENLFIGGNVRYGNFPPFSPSTRQVTITASGTNIP